MGAFGIQIRRVTGFSELFSCNKFWEELMVPSQAQ